MSNPTCNRSLRYLGRPSIRLHLPFTPQSSLPLGHRRNRTLAAGGSGSRRFIRLSRSMTESLLASLRMRQTATLTFCIRIQALLAKALRHISMGASSWPYTVSAYQGSIQRRVWPPDLSSSTVDSKLILRSSSRFGALNCSATQCTSKSVLPNQSRPFSLCPRPPSRRRIGRRNMPRSGGGWMPPDVPCNCKQRAARPEHRAAPDLKPMRLLAATDRQQAYQTNACQQER